MDALIKMTEGNPGALTVCMELIKKADAIDPDSLIGGFGKVLTLDTFEIYGPAIWMLYKDVCQQSLVLTIAALRAVQLGFRSPEDLHHAINNRGDGWDAEVECEKVKGRLPNFPFAKVEQP